MLSGQRLSASFGSLCVVLGSLPELFVSDDAVSLNVMRLLRLPRLLRSVKALYRVPSVRVLLKGLQAGAKETVSYVMYAVGNATPLILSPLT